MSGSRVSAYFHGRHHDEIEAGDVLDEIIEEQNALSFFAATLADGEQAREASPCGPVLRVGENVRRAIREHEPSANNESHRRQIEADSFFLCFNVLIPLLQRAI